MATIQKKKTAVKKQRKTKKTGIVRVGLVQTRAEKDPRTMLAKTLRQIDQVAKQGAQVVCLQELFLTYYFPQAESAEFFKHAEAIPGPVTKQLAAAAKKNKIVLIASLFEKRTAGIYHNTAAVFDADGSLLGIYRKMHIPDDPGFYEKYYFTPGDLGFRVFNTRYGKIAVLICWDQWYPEAARLAALQGAQILFYPTAIGVHTFEKDPQVGLSQHQAWETIQRAHSIANGVFTAAVNRVGTEGQIRFWGGSFVSDPFGRMLAKAGGAKDELLVIPCDLAKIEQTRQNWPFLRDRRVDAYGPITSRYLDDHR